MVLPPGVFVFSGPWHTFVLARGTAFRDLLRSGGYVELRPFDRTEARNALVRAAEAGSWQLRGFFLSAGIDPRDPRRRSVRSAAAELVQIAENAHFGILRELGPDDRGAERHGPTVGPVKGLLDVLRKERNGEISYKGRVYRVVASASWRAPSRHGGIEFEIVPAAEAEALLNGMADDARGAPAVKAALEEAGRFVDSPPVRGEHGGGAKKGVYLLREVQPAGGAAPEAAPASKPAPPKRAPASSAASDEEPEIRLVNIEAPTFVPGVETTKISYAIDGPVAKTASVTMIVKSVPARGEAVVVERLAIDGPYKSSGSLDWEGKASTPGGLITLKGSPYEIRFDLTSKSGHFSQSAVGKIRLEIKETKIVVDDTGPLDVPVDMRPSVGAFIAELKNSGMPSDCEGRIIIDSPLFKTDDNFGGDMYSDISYTSFRDKAGLGPTLPFVAQIKLKSKDGSGKRSAPVLIGTRLLWDFKLETSGDLEGALGGRGVMPTAKAFMKKVGAFEEAATQPKGASAHVKVGGLRARPVDRVEAGVQWSAGGDWDLSPPAQRDWAAFSSCGDSAFDAQADSAIYFSAGRMAGDTFKVRAVVDLDEAFDVVDEAAPDAAPATNRSNIVKVVNWRRVPIVGNWFIGATTTPITVAPLTTEYKRAAMLIEPGPGVVPTDMGPAWVREYQVIVDAAVAGAWDFLDYALLRDPGGYPVKYREFDDYWLLANPDAGFFGKLWERIKTFFSRSDEHAYRVKCDQNWAGVAELVTKRIPVPDNGITAIKFHNQGPHNQNPKKDSVTVGMAPAIEGLTTLTKAIFYQFTPGDDAGTFIHEVGHTLFLAHGPGHFHPPEEPGGFVATAHDKDQFCIMSYHPTAKYLCGLCLLKLGGRNFTKIKNDGTLVP